MSIHRHAARRDANEPAIRKRFAYHRWHTEQLSGTGMPDLLAWPLDPEVFLHAGRHYTLSALVDVKMPDGKVTKPQAAKWAQVAAKGIPVYVVRTEADVDALVAGTLDAWTLGHACRLNGCESGELCGTNAQRPSLRQPSTVKGKRKPASNYTPPRGERMEAAKGAEETFAPCQCIGRHTSECIQHHTWEE